MAQGPPLRHGHPYYMYEAIQAQPSALADVLHRNASLAGQAADLLLARPRLTLAGIGTSFHATLVGEHLFRLLTGHRVAARAVHSFDLVSYGALDDRDGLLVVSHRGTKTFSMQALERGRSQGAACVVVTGAGHGATMDVADVVLETVEQELSAAHTVSYTTALGCLGMVALEMGRRLGVSGVEEAMASLPEVPRLVERALALEDETVSLAQAYARHDRWLFLGAGPNAPTAYEAALKMKEANYTDSEGLHTEQALHGPPAHLREDMVVAAVSPPGPGEERNAAVLRVARSLGAATIALAEDGRDSPAAEAAEHVLRLPRVPEVFSPLVYVVPLQLLTYHVALARGANPDTMHRHEKAWADAHALFQL